MRKQSLDADVPLYFVSRIPWRRVAIILMLIATCVSFACAYKGARLVREQRAEIQLLRQQVKQSHQQVKQSHDQMALHDQGNKVALHLYDLVDRRLRKYETKYGEIDENHYGQMADEQRFLGELTVAQLQARRAVLELRAREEARGLDALEQQARERQATQGSGASPVAERR